MKVKYLLGLSMMLIQLIGVREASSCSRCSSTVENRSLYSIISRKKRYLVYPAGSNIVTTASIVKAMMFSAPRGFNLLGEIDFFYPLPNEIRYPKKKPTIPTTTTTSVPPPSTESWDYYHHNEIFSSPHDHRRQDVISWSHDNTDKYWKPVQSWKDYSLSKFTPYNMEHYYRPESENFALRNRKNFIKILPVRPNVTPLRPVTRLSLKPSHNYPKVSPYARRKNSWRPPIVYQQKPVGYASNYYLPRGRSIQFGNETVDDHHDWEYYHAHRDRRDLYSNLEKAIKIAGLDVKSCISRTICESQHFLHSQGKSLFHDLFRLFFTIPTKATFNDEYSRASRIEDIDDCWKRYDDDCPISVIDLVMGASKINTI